MAAGGHAGLSPAPNLCPPTRPCGHPGPPGGLPSSSHRRATHVLAWGGTKRAAWKTPRNIVARGSQSGPGDSGAGVGAEAVGTAREGRRVHRAGDMWGSVGRRGPEKAGAVSRLNPSLLRTQAPPGRQRGSSGLAGSLMCSQDVTSPSIQGPLQAASPVVSGDPALLLGLGQMDRQRVGLGV